MRSISFLLTLLVCSTAFSAQLSAMTVEEYLKLPRTQQIEQVAAFLRNDDADDRCHVDWTPARWTDVINKQLATGKSALSADLGEDWEKIKPGDDIIDHIKDTVVTECFCEVWTCE